MMTLDTLDTLDAASDLARSGLAAASQRLFSDGTVNINFDGQLLRPVLSIVGASPRTRQNERFWYAALAVQLAHEASLAHDDVVDNASTRRGQPTTFGAKGVAAALIEGDMLLTAAYVAAAATTSQPFVSQFADAVARTVSAERVQGSLLGRAVPRETYEQIALGKAGELMGCALSGGAIIEGECGHDHGELGREIGLLYQMMDDFLDYCPATRTGKQPLGDYSQGRWTWLLDHLPNAQLGLPVDEILASFHARFSRADSPSAMTRAAEQLRARITAIVRKSAVQFPQDHIIVEMLNRWSSTVSDALEREQAMRTKVARNILHVRSTDLRARSGEMGYLAKHSHSFLFASRLLPHELGRRIARVYAFCRFTDDLADEASEAGASRSELLNEWETITAMSYCGTPTGIPVIDLTMREMRQASVPFSHVADLCHGMRMDVSGATYATLDELRLYTHRVAGVVGLWITQLTGVHDAATLANAERMGHAMQLTNILRDVGEDWRNGRLYLPRDVLASYGFEPHHIGDMVQGSSPISDAYREMIRELVALAQADYRAAFAWLPNLPRPLQPGMAVAAELYEAIHDALRRNDYDNIHNRAVTSLVRKVGIATHALRSLRHARKMYAPLRAESVATSVLDRGCQI